MVDGSELPGRGHPELLVDVVPTRMTVAAPAALAAWAAVMPIGPGPMTATTSPALTSPRSMTSVTTLAVGSTWAASSKPSESGMRWSRAGSG